MKDKVIDFDTYFGFGVLKDSGYKWHTKVEETCAENAISQGLKIFEEEMIKENSNETPEKIWLSRTYTMQYKKGGKTKTRNIGKRIYEKNCVTNQYIIPLDEESLKVSIPELDKTEIISNKKELECLNYACEWAGLQYTIC